MDVEVVGRDHRVGIGAEPEEGDVAQVEQPGAADHDVEAGRQQPVDADRGQDAQRILRRIGERDGEGDQDRARTTTRAGGRQGRSRSLLDRRVQDVPGGVLPASRAPRGLAPRSPRMPVGFKVRTPTSTRKAITSL